VAFVDKFVSAFRVRAPQRFRLECRFTGSTSSFNSLCAAHDLLFWIPRCANTSASTSLANGILEECLCSSVTAVFVSVVARQVGLAHVFRFKEANAEFSQIGLAS
jgi:hypothetical protein